MGTAERRRLSRNSNKKNAPEGKRKPGVLLREVFLLLAVVAAALLIPQGIFLVQDEILCRKTELSSQDAGDIEFLGSNYEQSLHQRMWDFAEGLAAGDNFYVTSRNLVHNEELQEYLYSEKGLYQEMMLVFSELDLLYTVFWDFEASVLQWKQYVIYSDDYAKGVNFILWYIELLSGSDTVMKLLADGETGIIYAVKTESADGLSLQDTDMGGLREPGYWKLFEEEELCEDLLAYFMICYEAQGWEELSAVREGAYYDGKEGSLETGIRMRELAQRGEYACKDKTIWFQLPYEEYFLDYMLEIGDMNIVDDEKLALLGLDLVLLYPDVTMGIREIYELIPEFQ